MKAGENHSPLRVAQLIETLETGGAEHLAIRIANGRAAAGDESHLLVMTGPGALSPRIDSGVRVHYFAYERCSIRNPFRFALSVLRGYRMLRGRIKRHRIEVVQTHLPGANFWGLLLQIGRTCAVAPTIHNNQEFAYGDDVSGFRARLRRFAYRRLLRSCGAVICVSGMVRESLLAELGSAENDGGRIVVVPNGVALPEIRDQKDRAATRARYGIAPGAPMLLAAGRHTEQKDFATLLDSVARLRDLVEGPRLLLAGDGPLRADLERRAAAAGLADTVIFAGNVDDLDDLFQAADVFVMSSLWEGLPLTLLEAMAGACPVVGTSIPGIAEILDGEDGIERGLLAPPSDPDALAAAIAAMLGDPDRARRLGAAGRALVEERFSFARVDRDLAGIYFRLCGR